MTWIRNIAILVMLAAWVPASSHAFLEYFGIVHRLHCQDAGLDRAPHHHHHDEAGAAHHHHGHEGDQGHQHNAADHQHPDHHDAADGRSIVVQGKLRPAAPSQCATYYALPAWLVILDFDFVAQSEADTLHGQGVSPPELLPCWQFNSRAALPPRAPSFVA